MNKFKIIVVGILCLLSACMLRNMKAFSECEFKLEKVNSLTIAGVTISPSGQTKLSMQDALKLAVAFGSKEVPINLSLDIRGKNSNSIDAKMTKYDWNIKIKDKKVVSGSVDNTVFIPVQSSKVIDFETDFNLYPIITKYNMEEIKDIVSNVFDEDGNPNEIKIFIKPYVSIGKVDVSYPGFIEVTKHYKTE